MKLTGPNKIIVISIKRKTRSKMKIIMFLGAGASASFDKPTTVDFKNRLSNKISTDSVLYWFLNHYEYADVEELLQAIRDSKNLWDGYGGKFLSKPQPKLFVKIGNNEISFKDFLSELEKLQSTFNSNKWINAHNIATKMITSI